MSKVKHFTFQELEGYQSRYGIFGSVVLSHLLGEGIPDYFEPYSTLLFDIHMLMKHSDFPYIKPAMDKAVANGVMEVSKDSGLYQVLPPDTTNMSNEQRYTLDSATQTESQFGNYYMHVLLSTIKPVSYVEQFGTVVNNTASFFRFIERRLQYYDQLSRLGTPEVKPAVGRPKKDKPQKQRTSEGYAEWIAACRQHNGEIKQAWDEYQAAIEERKQQMELLSQKIADAKEHHRLLKLRDKPRLEDFN
ncbi:hypothetical protein vBAcoSR7M_67 [Alteromonas phage vB_AcoS-R7M]|uniref:Uncharacterized protein n=1 Tax=Alteromonas phage vB_AcoS-R7M TaxID=2729541 RepID=A0A6M3YNA3_9CAUD|nr:hypothetical protein HWD34_gp67 [Alteromonas phage vB_AcoS-R7M]QJI53389.1 hypothetical protein vBAcoSR7M_67 [Alteromonas phage vB_AcoS-R7M]